MMGRNDVLNNKQNPFAGFEDPRLPIWGKKNVDGEFVGMPYGMPANLCGAYINVGRPVNYLTDFATNPSIIVTPDFKMPIMDYAEVLFIQSEVNGFDDALYRDGVKASLLHWGVPAGVASAYAVSLPAADEERVLTQKWLANFMNGHNGWSEYRRTGQPLFLLVPGEISMQVAGFNGGNAVEFTALADTKDMIAARVTYPQIEATLNLEKYKAAQTAIGGDHMYTKVWWDTYDK